MKIIQHPSPNFNERKAPLDMLVLHYTGMETGDAALDRMCDEAASVSAHYMIRENGEVVQLVPEEKRAWHAGVSQWQGDEDLNSRSIGIEIVNGGHDWPDKKGALPAYPDAQIESVINLSKAIIKRWGIPQTRVLGHSDIAPARKQDPGEHFPWQRLSQRAVGLWPTEVAPSSAQLSASLAAIGYDLADERAAISAFQRHWRPSHITGTPDADTANIAAAIARLYSDS
jgi:N-acetylmuramoyl-L-alanine amidase